MYKPLLLALAVYITLLAYLWPFGEFVVSDEWAHTRQVEAFLHRSYAIQANTDATLILQAVLGFAAANTFGYSLTLMKIMAAVFFVFALVGLYFLAKTAGLGNKTTALVLVALVLNPIALHLSTVFMTDIPFLALFVWAVVFYVKALQNRKPVYYLLGSLFCGLSILIRQIGLAAFLAYTLAIVFQIGAQLKHKEKLDRALLGLLLSTLIIVAAIFVYMRWPRYSTSKNSQAYSAITNVLADTIKISDLPERVVTVFSSVFYLGFFTLPLTLGLTFRQSRKGRAAKVATALAISYLSYKADVFPIGNIFHLEGLYAKSLFYLETSVLNNPFAKLVISVFIGLALVQIGHLLFLAAKQKTLRSVAFYIYLVSLLSLPLFFINDLYDRYFLPGMVVTVLAVAVLIQKTGVTQKLHYALAGTLILALVSMLLVADYTQTTKLRWASAKLITAKTGVKTKILVSDAFNRYQLSRKLGDYTGKLYIPSNNDYSCFTEIKHVSHDTAVKRLLVTLSERVENTVGRAAPMKLKNAEVPSLDKGKTIISEREYYSPVYNLFGTRNYLVSWCLTSKLN